MAEETTTGAGETGIDLEQLLAVGEEEVGGIRMKVYTNRLKSMRDIVEMSTALYADREFIVYDDQRVTFAEFGRLVRSAGKVLQDHGVKKGDRVAMVLGNAHAFPIVFFAISCIGAISVPLNCWWKKEELEYGLSDRVAGKCPGPLPVGRPGPPNRSSACDHLRDWPSSSAPWLAGG